MDPAPADGSADPAADRTAAHLSPPLELPPLLAANQDPEVAAWRQTLPAVLAQTLDALELRAGTPFRPGGSASWVAPVRDAHGVELVLKVSFAHDEARDEAAGMLAWQGYGAAQILHAEQRAGSTVLLMEHVRPGTSLRDAADTSGQDDVLAPLLRRLWSRPDPLSVHPFRPLAQMCSWWADEARKRLAVSQLLAPGLVEHGLGLLTELAADGESDQVLLATDLHAGNVLRSEQGWVLIDPKPYLGDPHYDLLQHLLNEVPPLLADPAGRAAQLARRTGLDPRRAQDWLLARCVQEAGVMPGADRAAQLLARDEHG